MGSHLALLPAMEAEGLERLLASKRAQGPSGANVLASQVGNAVLLDLTKLGVKQVRVQPVMCVLLSLVWCGQASICFGVE